MTTDPTTAPLRLHMGAGGLVISGGRKVTAADGSSYVFKTLSGWDEPPALDMEIKRRAGEHGSTAGKAYQGERNLVIEGYAIVPGDDKDQLRAAVDRLFAAIPLEDELLVVHEYGLVRHLRVRQGGQPKADRIGRKSGRFKVASFSIQLVALDPIRFSGDGTGFTKTYETAPGGAGSVTVKTGDGLVPPMRLAVGECTNPRIAVTGQTGDLWYSLTVPAGGKLVIDTATRTAELNGSPVNGAMRGRWPSLQRKSNTFKFSAGTYGPNTSLTVDTFDTYP